ncbi:MAG: hypothetical protein JRD94_10415, partial [Deltaproteobacteria bacterium]|nr:hypothetical protein [Deltaproteobacteria bacterium]
MRLERLADLCAQVPGPRMTDALIAILNDAEPRVRVAAGEALRDLGYERYAELARGIERALDRNADGVAMSELPWVLAEIAEPSALALIRRFLDHSSPDVAAARTLRGRLASRSHRRLRRRDQDHPRRAGGGSTRNVGREARTGLGALTGPPGSSLSCFGPSPVFREERKVVLRHGIDLNLFRKVGARCLHGAEERTEWARRLPKRRRRNGLRNIGHAVDNGLA